MIILSWGTAFMRGSGNTELNFSLNQISSGRQVRPCLHCKNHPHIYNMFFPFSICLSLVTTALDSWTRYSNQLSVWNINIYISRISNNRLYFYFSHVQGKHLNKFEISFQGQTLLTFSILSNPHSLFFSTTINLDQTNPTKTAGTPPTPSCAYLFQDQFAFRPTGSTTAALINLFHKISILLQDNDFVHLISLDFSKAFDSVRHSTLIEKIAKFPIPSFAHNWLVEYLSQRQHCTKFNSIISLMLQINASIVQGSRIGPMAYVIDASDLHPVTPDNIFSKYADDTHLLVPSKNSNTIQAELDHVAEWPENNNLKLNTSKTVEIIVHKPRFDASKVPAPLQGISRQTQIQILGVTVSGVLTFDEHVNNIVAKAAQTGYALRILKAHGLRGQELHDVARSTHYI